MAEKGLLLYDNTLWRDGVTLTASSEALPVSRLLDYRPGRKWRATGDAAEWIKADHGAAVDIDTVLIYASNATTQASIEATARIRISANSDMSSAVKDETYELWPPVTGFGENFGQGFGGYPNLSEFNAYPQRRLIRLGAMYSKRYLRIDFADAANPAGYFEAGIVMAGVAYPLPVNFSNDWEVGNIDPTEHRPTDGGSVLIQAKTGWREAAFELQQFPLSAALTAIDDLQRIAGKKRPVLWVPFPGGALSTIYRTSIYGLMTDPTLIRGTSFDRAAVRFKIRELR